jgi:hypothetical protein
MGAILLGSESGSPPTTGLGCSTPAGGGTCATTFAELTDTPTTLAGYGISDTKSNFNTACSDGTFLFSGDPIGAHNQAWSTITATPTTIAGYSLSDTKSNWSGGVSDGTFLFVGDAPTAHNQAWSTITSTPTTISGYSLSDTKANFNIGLSDGSFAFDGGAHHDGFSDFVAAEHINWSVTGAEDVHVDRIAAGAVTQHVASIDHDSLLNFAAGEHFTQAAISITASQVSDFDTEVANETSVAANTSARHAAVTLGTNLGNNLLGLSTQQITLDSQTGNTVFCSPSGGGAGAPAFRSLVVNDIPDLSAVYEAELGNPGVSGYVLTSTDTGIRSWVSQTGGMVYPGAGIAVSTGAAWGTSITDNSTTWNAAQPGHVNLTSLAALTYASASFVKMTATGTFALDTNTYVSAGGAYHDGFSDFVAGEHYDLSVTGTTQYIHLAAGGFIVRLGVRGNYFVRDRELTATGFAGSENTDWENNYSELINWS